MHRTLAIAALCGLSVASLALAGGARDPFHSAIRDAVSEDPTRQVVGIRTLREAGETGLEALLDAADRGLFKATEGQWDHAIDEVAGQRDARWSQLFWYMDIEAAKAEARETGKPILSLRMLGDLRDSHSCANSRFFRAALYTHPELAEKMDDDFVLHWSSERDVPQITIRFGDGREIHSTVTGNSIHYVLDAEGRPIEALPGLFTPETFMEQLSSASFLHETLRTASDRSDTLREHHADELAMALERIRLQQPNVSPPIQVLDALLTASAQLPDSERVPAAEALPIALGKGRIEQPFVGFGPPAALTPDDLGVTDAGTLHPRSRAFVVDQRPAGPTGTADDVDALLARFESDMQRDSTFNRDVLQTRIHSWFANDEVVDFAGLNERVYTDLFATPAADAWLGLHDPTVYTGLQDAGIVVK